MAAEVTPIQVGQVLVSPSGADLLKDRSILLGIPEIAEILGCCEQTVRNHCANGDLRHISRKIGRRWFIHRDRLAEYLLEVNNE